MFLLVSGSIFRGENLVIFSFTIFKDLIVYKENILSNKVAKIFKNVLNVIKKYDFCLIFHEQGHSNRSEQV